MARGGGMQEVELDDVPGPSSDDAPRERSRWRRPWWVLAVVGALALGVVGVQLVADARERAAVARLSQVRGVLAPVDPTLPVAWRSESMGEVMWSPVAVRGASLGAVVADDGSQRLVAYDLATGKELWSTELYGPDPARAAARSQSGGMAPACVPTTDGPDPARVACIVSDGFLSFDKTGQITSVPSTASFVRVVDTSDGSVVAQWPAGGGSLVVLDDVAVLATYDADAAVTLDARDLLTGEPRWTAHGPKPATDTSGWTVSWPPNMNRVGDLLALSGLDGGTTLFDAAGRSLDDELAGADGSDGLLGGQVFELPAGGRLVYSSQGERGQSSSTVLADGRAAFTFVGDPVVPALDDGSVPGLLLVAAVDDREGAVGPVVLTGLDAETGRRRWTSTVLSSVQFPGALVMRGRAFVQTLAGLTAIDARTGEELWSADSPKGMTFSEPMTDGRYLLVNARKADDGRAAQIVAFDPATGDQVWRSPVPDGIDYFFPIGGVLLGMRTDTNGRATEVLRFG